MARISEGGTGVPRSSRTTRGILLATTLAFAALLLVVSSARADYEQVPEHFGASGEAEQLNNSQAIAINVDGIGGVEAGSIYAAGLGGRVVRFTAGSEGEPPQFREAWGWGAGNGAGEFQRCGPAYSAEPRPAATFPTCRPLPLIGAGGEETGHFNELAGVAVDQATGDVYVLNQPGIGTREHHLVEVFTANGTPVGEGFGDFGHKSPTSPESIAEGPEKLHEQFRPEEDGIAVDESGTVYVIDRDFPAVPQASKQSRVMSFEPEHAGDYEHYVYAGQNKDLTVSEAIAGPGSRFRRIALMGASRLVAGSFQQISEYPTGGGSAAICTYEVSGGQVAGLAANPVTGEVFYFVEGAHSKLHRLGPCDATTGEFEELQGPITPAPETESLFALAVNPTLAWSPLRPVGVLYGADAEEHGSVQPKQKGIGDVFVPSEVLGPAVTSESVANTTPISSTLQAQIDPRGSTTSFRFQYLTQAQYEANEPDERQSLTVSATGGLLGLGFEGRNLGGAATANLTSGSATASGLITARGSATWHVAKGTATLTGAVGKGTVISGSSIVTVASTAEGAFEKGQTISGAGIPEGTTITAISGSELTLSAPATGSVANTELHAGTTGLTALTTAEGAFEAGMSIAGQGIAEGTTITAVSGKKLTLSKPVTKPGVAVEIKAGSTTLDGLTTTEGTFVTGQPIAGEGIPAGTTIIVVESGSLRISKAPTKPGTGVAVSSSGPAPLAVGEVVEGPGIPAGTTIAAIAAGELTLSNPATSSTPEAHLRAGLPFDAPAAKVRKALEGLATIGKGDVEVSGGPGDGSGSRPYEVTYTGALTNQDLPELSAEAAGLTGGPATATVTTLRDGGGGFDHGAAEAPVPAGTLGAGGVATAPVAGLAPETAYRFRVIATSGCKGPGEPPCESFGQAASFRTYPPTVAGLPDDRAYELVSPAQKQGGEVFPADHFVRSCVRECKPPGPLIFSVFPMQSSPGGNSVSFMGYPFSPTAGAAVFNSYISRRTPSGWQTTAMSPRLLPNVSSLAYAESLGQGVITLKEGHPPQLAASAPAGYANLYLQQAANPAVLQPALTDVLFEAHPPHREPGSLQLEYAGHSPDFSAQFFTANDVFTSSTAYGPEPPAIGPSERDLYEWREGELNLVNVLPGNTAVATGASFASASPDTHAVSTNGGRVYWKAGGHLYVREDNRTTREIHDPGSFLTASPDGLEALLSDGCLYSLTTAKCGTDLTQGKGGFLGIAGQSEGLSRIYFVATAALPGENNDEDEAEPGKPNLYLYEAGVGTSFVTTLEVSDGLGGLGFLNDWTAAPGQRTAEASPDGRYLAFASTAQLTGHANVGLCGYNANVTELAEARCHEVFLYDSITGNLTCPSCNPTAEAPLGNSTLRRIYEAAANAWLPQPRYLTDQGRLFFDSSERLSPRDVNGRVEDVYEFEPSGIGTCGRAGGCVSLISSGAGSVDSNFLAMDESGNNVFFTSREQLVKQDTDNLLDVYDARVGGGFAGENETAASECRGEACQPTTNPPAAPNSGTSGFQGTGNVEPEKTRQCPKGKVRQKGKCVRQKAKKQKKNAKKKQPRTAGHERGGAK
jgi:hypothetical protein